MKDLMNWVKLGFFLATCAALGGCPPVGDDRDIFNTPHSGQVNLRKFVAVGDSFLAGYMDGALYNKGQENSIPLIIARQLETVGASAEFPQPTINAEIGFHGYDEEGNTLGRMVLVEDTSFPYPIPQHITPGQEPSLFFGRKDSIQNFSVPGLKAIQALQPSFGSQDIYYARFASSPGTSTLMADAIQANPSFFLLWLGTGDIFNYAVNGATGIDGALNTNDLTSVENFEAAFEGSVNTLVSGGANGLIGNIPNVRDFPYFNTVPINFLTIDQTDSLRLWDHFLRFNVGVVGWNAGVRGRTDLTEAEKEELIRPIINFDPTNPRVLIEDNDLSEAVGFYPDGLEDLPKIRQAVQGELVLLNLPYQQVIDGLGTTIPIPDRSSLTLKELERIDQRTEAFNQTITAKIESLPDLLRMADMHQAFENMALGFPNNFNGEPFLPTYLPPSGAFSVDGIYLNPRGNAHIANKFIEAMNLEFQSNIPFAPVNDFQGNDPL